MTLRIGFYSIQAFKTFSGEMTSATLSLRRRPDQERGAGR
jgi:hypothetical protein